MNGRVFVEMRFVILLLTWLCHAVAGLGYTRKEIEQNRRRFDEYYECIRERDALFQQLHDSRPFHTSIETNGSALELKCLSWYCLQFKI